MMRSPVNVIRGHRAAWLFGTVALAIALPGSAFAQSAEPQSETAKGSDEIIVTANRREERSQDVPIVITSYSAAQLSQRNITEAKDLYGTAPSLVVGNQGQATRDVQSFSIRGQSTGYLSSPAVAQYFAEVPLAASVTLNLQGAPGMFLDLENVQVLSGPQGTLFGRNTTGGAVLFSPHKPTNEFEGYIEGTYGSHKLAAVEGAINIPVIDDKLLIRVAGTYRDRDGFTRDLLFNKNRDDVHYYSGRISVLMRPFEGFENTTVVFGTKSRNNGTGFIHEGFNIDGLKGVGFCGDTPAAIVPGLGVNCNVYRSQTTIANQIGPRQTRSSVDAFSEIKLFGVINTSTFDLSDNLTLRNIISYQRLKDNYANDQDGTPLQQYEGNQNAPNTSATNIDGLVQAGLPLFGYINAQTGFKSLRDDLKQFTEELQLQGKALDGKMDYAVGFFHYSATPGSVWASKSIVYCPALFTGACPYNDATTGVSNKSNAVYAQATVDLGAFTPSLDSLRLTAGYRYTWDTVSGFTSTFSATLKSKAPTWTIGLDYKPMNNVLVYAKVSRGYKAGGFNVSAVRIETETFDPEQLTSYEAGFKSDLRLGDVPLKLNATYYYSDYKNIQRPAGDFNPTPPAGLPQNGARILGATARIQGIELEASIRPAKGLEFGGNFSYTDAKYKKFDAPIFSPTVTCSGLKNFGETGDFSCRPFQFVSPYIVNIYASLDLPLSGDLGSLSFYTNYSHVAAQGTAPLGDAVTEPGSLIAGYGLLNASVSWKNVAGSGVDLTAFGTNLTNTLYRTSNSNVLGSLLVRTSIYGEPSMYGVKVRFSF